MKKHLNKLPAIVLMTFLHCLILKSAFSQVPQLFNYQGIARDAKGNPLSKQKMAIKLSVLPAADATEPEYEETQIVSTNEFGLYTLQIGAGTPLRGQMKTVKWETGNKYIRVAIDPGGGDQYADAGTNQLLSVPYALYAGKAGETAHNENDKTRAGTVSTSAAGTGTTNFLTKFTAANTIYNSQIFDNGTNIGIGTVAPASKLHLLTTIGNIEHIRMQNTNSSGHGKFLMHNDNPGNYATFTKYGSAFPGGYPGVASQFPYANMLAFGNNLGPFLLANNGNVGLGIVTAGTTKLYLNAQQASGYLGLGGSALPAANVHINNSATGDTLRITNATTGHMAGDGLEIRNTGNAASIVNNENSTLSLGTNTFPSILNLTPAGNAEVSGLLKIAGGSPSFGYVLTTDATGLGSWQVPASTLPNGSATGNTPYWNGSTWVVNSSHLYNNGSKIGINTTTPQMRTHINDTSGKVLLLENSKPLAVGHTTGQYFKAGNLYTGAIKTTGTGTTSARMGFYTGADSFATDLMERVTISENGSVGIGDTSPAYKLEVAGTIHGTNAIIDNTLSASSLSITSNAFVDGNLDVDGNTIVNGDGQIDGTLSTGGTATIGGSLTVAGSGNITGNVLVSSGQGLVKSNVSTQRNLAYVSGYFSFTNMASNGFGDITYALPDITGTANSVKVSVAQFVPTAGTGDGWRKFIITTHSVDVVTNSCKISVYNASASAATINGTLHLILVYND